MKQTNNKQYQKQTININKQTNKQVIQQKQVNKQTNTQRLLMFP